MDLKLLLCDDSDLQLKETTTFVHSCLNTYTAFTSVINPYKPEELKKLLENDMLDYDIAILDIEMGELNGIDLASAINQRCPQCAVIFLTSHTDYISDSYEVRHIYYVTKDSIQRYLPKALDKAVRLTVERKTRFLDITSNRKRYTLPCDSITYIERIGREIWISTQTKGDIYDFHKKKSQETTACQDQFRVYHFCDHVYIYADPYHYINE